MTNLVWALIFYTVGWLSGYFVQKEKIQDIIEETRKHIEKLHKDDLPVGALKRPTAQELYKKTDPYEKKIAEGKQAMAETLANIKELK